MKGKRLLGTAATAALALLLMASLALAESPQGTPLGSKFTYQGRLKIDDLPYTGTCDFKFGLWDAFEGGAQVGILTLTDVQVYEGRFTVLLDYGAGAFPGEARWLEKSVRCPAGTGTYQVLSPRQGLTATPYALYSKSAPWSGLVGNPVAWVRSGNGGTTPGTDYLGTSDNAALDLKVNGARALRLVPDPTSPSLLGGYSGNWLAAEAYGAAIGGGGFSASPNRVTDVYGAVGGGAANQAGDDAGTNVDAAYATVGGGWENTAGGMQATVGGGKSNLATGDRATVSGGASNLAVANYATVGGGEGNQANGLHATAGGGKLNIANSDYATIGGGYSSTAGGVAATVGGGYDNNAPGEGATVGGGTANYASGAQATIAGGQSNSAPSAYATVGGGNDNTASGQDAVVGGGSLNTASGTAATVGGGSLNTASGGASSVPGGQFNTAAGSYSFAAGRRAKANAAGCFVWADSTDADYACSQADQFAARATGGVRLNVDTVGGGLRIEPALWDSANTIGGYGGNSATEGAWGTTIAGGGYSGGANRVTDYGGTVGGGADNSAGNDGVNTNDATYATVGGGVYNHATAHFSTVTGGNNNQATDEGSAVAGGTQNLASGSGATVGGGTFNVASGPGATVPGGELNTAAGTGSFAAGRNAKANQDGCFVWADHYGTDVVCNDPDRWVARAQGGVYFFTDTGMTTGSFLAAGGSSWSSISDRATKENFAPADAQAILDTLASLPIQEYNLKSQDDSIRHVGLVAQDFGLFGYGESDTAINLEDADGVAMAAIQALYARNQALQAETVDQQAQIDALEARLSALEQAAQGSPRRPAPWLLAGGLVVAGGGALAARRRRPGGTR